MKKESVVPLLVIMTGIILVFSFVLLLMFSLASKAQKTSSTSAIYCPESNRSAMAVFINQCEQSASGAYCYALAKGEFCQAVSRL